MQVTLNALPATLAEFQAMPQAQLRTPEDVCAAFLCALHLYLKNQNDGVAAMNVLRGPRPMAPYDSQFLRDRLRGKEYLPLALWRSAASSVAAQRPSARSWLCSTVTSYLSARNPGNPTVVPGQFSGALKPDFVIPFKLSKEDAVAALKNHYKGKPFLPKAFTAGNHIEEIKGVYVPFWMFDGEAEGSADYEGLVSYTYKTGDYRVTETKHYDVHRAGSIAFEKVPVDASSKMPDDHMDSIEPYDYAELKPFSTAYLPGFLADKYDVTVEQSHDRADGRCAATLEAALRHSASEYDACIPRGQNIRLRRGKVHYALLPVWMLHTKWNGKDFLFAMNGQTGRLVGDLPMSWSRFWTTFAAIAVPAAAIATVIASLF